MKKPMWTVRIVACLAGALTLASCSTGSRLTPMLSEAASQGAAAFAPVSDDILTSARVGAIKIPPGLREALDNVPTGGLSTSDEALLSTARNWDSTLSFWNRAIDFATGWDSGLSDEAASLVALSMYVDDVDPRFAQQIDDLIERLLRSATCQGARQGLDAASAAVADQAGLTYDASLPTDETGMEAFLRGVLEQEWDAASLQATIDLLGLASRSVARANEWVNGMNDVIESPNGTLLQANIFYFRACVARA